MASPCLPPPNSNSNLISQTRTLSLQPNLISTPDMSLPISELCNAYQFLVLECRQAHLITLSTDPPHCEHSVNDRGGLARAVTFSGHPEK
ncbi:hypothetical protein M378DRAFT_165621 [Amanita muscaria Koide BX008]|uniref:Uncharacterized protein n=1 Tax=Amanita muscaria (strain Koide BX008) TaxID=946122 RepID=A0A0C2T7L7_AMAMK|nr:hypothetical protein M378DRAFT_165621 [Amanita muscaria Koide BX008]